MIALIWLLLSAVLAAVDQLSKDIVEKNVGYGEKITVIKDFFFITNHRNEGAAWGVLQGANYIFIPLSIILMTVMIYYIIKRKEKFLKVTLAIILGGALGNFIDRIFQGGVTDFLDFYIGSFNFPTFNFADMCITCGTILLAIFLLFIHKENGVKTDEQGG